MPGCGVLASALPAGVPTPLPRFPSWIQKAHLPVASQTLRQIPTDRLRIGMFVHSLGMTWTSHPFWRRKFLVESPSDLEKIAGLGIPTVCIDTALGLDLPEDPAPVAEPVRAAAPVDPRQLRDAAGRVVAQLFDDAQQGRVLDLDGSRWAVDGIVHSVDTEPDALLAELRCKATVDYTHLHSVAVSALMVRFARHLGLDDKDVRHAALAGLLHDVGKARVSPALLNHPGRLEPRDMNVVREHASHGHRLLVRCHGLDPVVMDACLHHHERFDGDGYPHGLAGEQIQLLARMVSLCDVFDALTSNRAYKRAWDPAVALQTMATWDGQFDPRLFRAFVRVVGVYPPGSLVRLSHGYLGVVFGRNGPSITRPCVRVFYSWENASRVTPFDIDLSAADDTVQIVAKEDGQEWPFDELAELARVRACGA
ncbi:HD-GYP domain-containing protein [Luteibacter sahnii]|uniref:HD-GYP domain-containing protein n=1 Tax=Luteibacter sahnii TaxID=3021977 RepID=UPI002A6A2A55|nr:HD-GYP domain-containing protein [Luteibacter sp. PPL193]MDY1548023.1 HD-GYP domain-containing protein [Luteibacter sp. PPL193]